MSVLSHYDPEVQPHAQAWLELDEQERIALTERCHQRAGIDLPNATAHAVFHAIASVLADHIYERVDSKIDDAPEVAQARYDSAVERLTAKEWLAKYDAP